MGALKIPECCHKQDSFVRGLVQIDETSHYITTNFYTNFVYVVIFLLNIFFPTPSSYVKGLVQIGVFIDKL